MDENIRQYLWRRHRRYGWLLLVGILIGIAVAPLCVWLRLPLPLNSVLAGYAIAFLPLVLLFNGVGARVKSTAQTTPDQPQGR